MALQDDTPGGGMHSTSSSNTQGGSTVGKSLGAALGLSLGAGDWGEVIGAWDMVGAADTVGALLGVSLGAIVGSKYIVG